MASYYYEGYLLRVVYYFSDFDVGIGRCRTYRSSYRAMENLFQPQPFGSQTTTLIIGVWLRVEAGSI